MGFHLIHLICVWLCSVCLSRLLYDYLGQQNAIMSLLLSVKTNQYLADVSYSWNQLHEYYVDHSLFSKDRPHCFSENYLFPIRENLFFVNEAMVKIHGNNVIYIPINKYSMECKGTTSVYRFTKIMLGSLGVGLQQ